MYGVEQKKLIFKNQFLLIEKFMLDKLCII